MQKNAASNSDNVCHESIFYDGECRMCRQFARRFQTLLNDKRIGLIPYQDPRAQGQIPGDHDPAQEILLKTKSGRILGGADALIYLARRIWWAYGLYLLARVPGVRNLMRKIYRHIAAHRHCQNN